MSAWTPFPHGTAFQLDAATLRARWPRLHAWDGTPLPHDESVLAAWALLHAGDFEQAERLALQAGPTGLGVANHAAACHASWLEASETARLERLRQVHQRALAHAAEAPGEPSAWYWQGQALLRHAQAIGVARALAQGLGERIRIALTSAIELAPGHAGAHVAWGTFHAATLHHLGARVGSTTYGASPDAARRHVEQALALAPESPPVLLECVHALALLDTPEDHAWRLQLHQQLVGCTPLDAIEQLCVDIARAEFDA